MKALFEPPERPEKGLTHSFIIGLRANPLGGHYDVADLGETASLRIRVSQRAKKFYMSARWRKGATSATSRLLGEFWEGDGAPLPCFLTLAGARQKTREWEKLRRAGTDPRTTTIGDVTPPSPDEISSDDKDGMITSFAFLAKKYLKSDIFLSRRSSQKSERRIRYYLLDPKRNPLLNKPACKVSDTEITELIDAISQHSPSQARQVLQDIKQIYKHGMSARLPEPLRLTANPAAGLKSKDLGLKNTERQVILLDDEIVAYWRASETLGYPYGPFFQLLLVLMQRRGDIANARWNEIDWRNRVMKIPGDRFKSGVMHLVPLPDLALKIIDALPTDSGDYLFTTTLTSPIAGFSNATARLKAAMTVELARMNEERGMHGTVVLTEFRLHDVRRVGRTGLSALHVPKEVAELVIGHGKKGLDRIYNLYEYLPEMRDALQKWAEHIETLVGLSPSISGNQSENLPDFRVNISSMRDRYSICANRDS